MKPKKVDVPYIAISPHPNGSYGWAMDQLTAGNDMRRWGWPVEVSEHHGAAIWHLFRARYDRSSNFDVIHGFYNGVVGEWGDSLEGYGMLGGSYTPSTEDRDAKDWQYVTDVTLDQILYLNGRRPRRIGPRDEETPSPVYMRDEKRFVWACIGIMVLVIVLIGVFLA
jgi:hypothetical protein